MNRPLLSVVIPTWNRAHLVCDAVDSALDQGSSVQVIVVDDGSTDDTRQVLSARFGSLIKLVLRADRGGVGAARNAGIRHATGELIAFLDSDDLWLPGKLDAEMRLLELHPDVEVIISDSLAFAEDKPNHETWFEWNGLKRATGGKVTRLSSCGWLWGHWSNTVAMCSITMRRRVLARLGEPIFPEDLVAGEDWEMEMRLYNESRVVVLPEVWSHVRRFDDGTRVGRHIPGTAPTPSQNVSVLRAKLTILERTLKLSGLAADITSELEQCRCLTAQQLAQFESIDG
jgi:glycosyltransferase involved in cell wall biosynthesis